MQMLQCDIWSLGMISIHHHIVQKKLLDSEKSHYFMLDKVKMQKHLLPRLAELSGDPDKKANKERSLRTALQQLKHF